jgi:hypothetical protein
MSYLGFFFFSSNQLQLMNEISDSSHNASRADSDASTRSPGEPGESDEPPIREPRRAWTPFQPHPALLFALALVFLPTVSAAPMLEKRSDHHSATFGVEAAMIPVLVLASGVLAGPCPLTVLLSFSSCVLTCYHSSRPYAWIHVPRCELLFLALSTSVAS